MIFSIKLILRCTKTNQKFILDIYLQSNYNKKYDSEMYRSGHNENDSKSFCLHGHVGSNPTVSANTKKKETQKKKETVKLFFSTILGWIFVLNLLIGINLTVFSFFVVSYYIIYF